MYDTTGCACTIACCSSFFQRTRKNLHGMIFNRCRLVGIIQTRVLPNRKQIQHAIVLPARILHSSTACGGKVSQQIGTFVHFSGKKKNIYIYIWFLICLTGGSCLGILSVDRNSAQLHELEEYIKYWYRGDGMNTCGPICTCSHSGITGVHINYYYQDLRWCVTMGVYMGFWVHGGS